MITLYEAIKSILFSIISRLALNQVVKGRQSSYQIAKSLAQNVFQANVVGTHTSVVIKVAPDTSALFINEANTYQHSCIAKSPYIRSLREYINNGDSHCLVLEWMDNTLWETKEASIQAKVNVFKTVAKSCLEALAVFGDMGGTG
ncbi:hypothetical protein IFR05_000194 [Cadophora sp. M221]|nr:hypothetical protein IFR05_000194 [Cadophora sp. M221]